MILAFLAVHFLSLFLSSDDGFFEDPCTISHSYFSWMKFKFFLSKWTDNNSDFSILLDLWKKSATNDLIDLNWYCLSWFFQKIRNNALGTLVQTADCWSTDFPLIKARINDQVQRSCRCIRCTPLKRWCWSYPDRRNWMVQMKTALKKVERMKGPKKPFKWFQKTPKKVAMRNPLFDSDCPTPVDAFINSS